MSHNEIVCMTTSIKILRTYGVFPSQSRELHPGMVFYIRFLVLAVVTSLTLVGSTLHLIKTIQNNEYNYTEMDLVYIVSFVTAYALIGSFVMKVKASGEMFVFLSNFEEFGKPINFDKNNKLFNRYSKYHYVYLESLILIILFSSNIFKSKTCRLENELYNLKEVCGLFTYTWMPFNIDYTPVREIYLTIQLLGNHHIYMLAGLVAWQVFETIQHIIIRIRHVKHLFVEALQEGDVKVRRKKFNFAVRYHNAVLSAFFSLEDKLNAAFGIFMVTHMVLTAAVIGTGIYCLFRRRSLSSFLVCMGWFWGLFMDCFSGQRLQDESLELAVALYDSPWYEMDKEFIKDIMFVLSRCQIPMKLRAYAFGVIDRAMFLAVMKGTYSYITLLRSQ
uniref:Odorant receptor n=1 Tax=Colaphellus bowringi TaxID=561076 RepID=A0A0S3J2R7_9CUCU|nr:odorant receptor OR35 [Colaphellus bowringi]